MILNFIIMYNFESTLIKFESTLIKQKRKEVRENTFFEFQKLK